MKSLTTGRIAALMVLALAVAAGFDLARDQRVPANVISATQEGPTFLVPDSELPPSVSIVVYGDMRFTDPSNTRLANPRARRLLAEKVASEHPDAVELTGDVPYAGSNRADYDEFRAETSEWRAENLRVFPALGNHEMVGGAESLKNWWNAFPELNNRQWYSVQLGERIYLITLYSNSDLLEGSPQMIWLKSQIAQIRKSVDFVFVVLHHPPVADRQTLTEVDHNPRRNEIALRNYLSSVAPKSHAVFIVAAGHIHNYERFIVDGVTYLVSGGGGARPYLVERTPADQYQTTDTVNFHYILFRLDGKELSATMYRLADPEAQTPEWQARDKFTIVSR
ncbi:MAG: metallophosphoesterase family protein [Terracidiphilus sp.]